MIKSLTPRETIALLETQADTQDILIKNLLDELRAYAVAGEDLDALVMHETRMRCERSAIIAEAAMMISEVEHGCTIRQLFRNRKPALRIVQ